MKYTLALTKTFTFICIVALMMCSVDVMAQCPMCKTAAESNLKNGGSAGTGLNAGILYMLSMPYVLLMVFGYLYYKHRQKQRSSTQVMGAEGMEL